ncbi:MULTISPECIES: PepSY-associated TM helix domain-containing protein [Catenuloplanes]|uniref:Iron-regulated membrane protein n=1 Tax=Catenuloplanes niger TaxID=587534 RepID=A0AAE4CRG7_9ACTN|nr:PepSY-associated TM helix domain-containing protein [Catenuloplanes niger]MDR7320128.1 putative iron-regulated membrane protein [Catenuloplanes niger]
MPEPPPRRGGWAALRPLIHRLHFYAGVLIGPFLLVAALSGGLYALSPQLEKVMYADLLTGGPATVPLARQVAAAQAVTEVPGFVAVRPAPAGGTTRVIFDDGSFPESYRHAVFVDPADGSVRGQATVYGTTGALPVRSWIDELHRSLHLGEAGRLYSELAASWLWVVALGGLALWLGRARRRVLVVDRRARGRARSRSWHAVTGVWLLLGFLALSATGLTWSQYAGANVTTLRAQLGWSTPALNTAVDPAAAPSTGGDHAGHGGHAAPAPGTVDVSRVDAVLAAARAARVDSDQVEIGVPAGEGRAWTVTEVHRAYPTSVDSAAVDPATLAVTDVVRFADYPFMAKMARWGVDLHMGTLFGLPNQVALALLAAGLVAVVVLGYRMWWQRRPTGADRWRPGPVLPPGGLRALPWPALPPIAVVTVAVGWFLPLLGLGLATFLLADVLLAAVRRHRAA